MSTDSIRCPHCQKPVSLTQAMTEELQGRLEARFQSELAAQKKALEDQQLRERQKLEAQLAQKLSQQWEVEQKDLQQRVQEQERKIQEATQRELELRKLQRSLEDQKKEQELELQRRLDEQRQRIADESAQRTQAAAQKIIDEQNQKIEQMQRALTEATRKSQQGSQQLQGEALEARFEELLPQTFPGDLFDAVPKGKRGADINQTVLSRSGKPAGRIVIEIKQTTTWQKAWLGKIKEDQRALAAEVAVLVTEIMPPDLQGRLDQIEGVWVVGPELAVTLIKILREQLLLVHQAKMGQAIQGDQKEQLFQFMTSTRFRQLIESEVEAVSQLREELQQEKRAMTRIWSRREVQLEQLMSAKAGLYGELQAFLGKSLPTIERLELISPEESGETPESQ